MNWTLSVLPPRHQCTPAPIVCQCYIRQCNVQLIDHCDVRMFTNSHGERECRYMSHLLETLCIACVACARSLQLRGALVCRVLCSPPWQMPWHLWPIAAASFKPDAYSQCIWPESRHNLFVHQELDAGWTSKLKPYTLLKPNHANLKLNNKVLWMRTYRRKKGFRQFRFFKSTKAR